MTADRKYPTVYRKGVAPGRLVCLDGSKLLSSLIERPKRTISGGGEAMNFRSLMVTVLLIVACFAPDNRDGITSFPGFIIDHEEDVMRKLFSIIVILFEQRKPRPLGVVRVQRLCQLNDSLIVRG